MAHRSEGRPIRGSHDERLAYLRRLGFGDLQHDSHVPFLSHLIGTARLLRQWGSPDAWCDAGLFHSVYGTEYFQPDEIADRDEVRAIIGESGERVAWLWCVIERNTLDPQSRSVTDRHSNESLELTETEVTAVATLWVADTVEQIERMSPEERSFATGLPAVLAAATGPAREAVRAVEKLLDPA